MIEQDLISCVCVKIQQPFTDFADGFRCFLGDIDECAGQQTALLLVGYTVMNMMFNTLGLYLTQQVPKALAHTGTQCTSSHSLSLR